MNGCAARVLFIPRPDADRIFGGDVVQMTKTAQAMRALGATVDIGPPEAALTDSYDVVHLWTSLHVPHMLMPQLDALAPLRGRVPLAFSPIWAPHHLVRWMDAARRWLFARHPDGAALDLTSAANDLRAIASRALDFTLDGQTLSAFAPHPFTAACRRVLERIDLILPNSWMELSAIFTFLGDYARYAVVPNAVDARDFEDADIAELPPELREGPYIVMSARFDPRKQQDFAMLALKRIDAPIVFVGEPSDTEMFARVQALAVGRSAPVFHYPFMPHARLKHVYAGARVHVLPSLFESPGLSSLEAALLERAIVVGNLAFEAEYFREGAYYCDPCDAFSIERAVRAAWENFATDAPRRAELAHRIRTDYTWEQAAQATLRTYTRVAISATPTSAKSTPAHCDG